jgi:channel protein (hemolysin III family)
MYPIPGFSDPVSSLSHLLGAGVFACLTPFLLWRGRGNALRLTLLSVFAFSTVFLLSMSGVYHLLSEGGAGRAVLQRLDHGAIFVLIAGTFTPLHGILFRGWWRWGPLLFVWAAAITGITLKTIFFTGLAEWLGLTFYLALGWFGAVSGLELWRRHGMAFVRPMLWGGVAYTIGGTLEFLRPPFLIPGVLGPHELFHLAVLVGISFHWRFVWQFASGKVPPRKSTRPGSPAAPGMGLCREGMK